MRRAKDCVGEDGETDATRLFGWGRQTTERRGPEARQDEREKETWGLLSMKEKLAIKKESKKVAGPSRL